MPRGRFRRKRPSIQVGGCRVKAKFLVCRSLLVPILIRTAFVKQNVRAMLPMDRQLQVKNGDEVPILESVKNDDIVKERAKWTIPEVVTGSSSNVKVAKFARPASQSQTRVDITSEVEGTYVLELRAKYLPSIRLVMSNDIIALKTAVKEKIFIANFWQTRTELNKGTGNEVPKCVRTKVICYCQLTRRQKNN